MSDLVRIVGANPSSCNPVRKVGNMWVCENCGTPHKTTSTALYHTCPAKKGKEVPNVVGSLVVEGPKL